MKTIARDLTKQHLSEWADTTRRDYAAALANDGSWKRLEIIQPLYAEPQFIVSVGAAVVYDGKDVDDAIETFNAQ